MLKSVFLLNVLFLTSTMSWASSHPGADQGRQLDDLQQQRRRRLYEYPVNEQVDDQMMIDDNEEEEIWNNDPLLPPPSKLPPSSLKGPPKGSQGINF